MRALSQARSAAGQWDRASEIATVLWSSGFSWAVDALGLRSCVSFGCRTMCATEVRQCHHHVDMDQPLPVRMRLVVERLGPTFVKAGQLLALRPDHVPLEYAQALRTLQDQVTPFPAHLARAVVEAELGAPLQQLFSRFEPEPFAAAVCEAARGIAQAVTLEVAPTRFRVNVVLGFRDLPEPVQSAVSFLESAGGAFAAGATLDVRQP